MIASKLPGIPEEYYEYIYTFAGESVDEMAESIRTILSKPQEQLRQKGLSAYRFVTEQKNSVSQAKKLLELIEKVQ